MNSSTVRYWFIAGLLVVASIVVYLDTRSNLRAPPRTSRLTTPVLDEQEVQEQPESYLPSKRTKRAGTSENDTLPALAVDAAEPDEEHEPDANGRSLEELHVALNNSFESDGLSDPGATRRTQELRSLFQNLETPGVYLDEAECRDSYCRVQVSYPSPKEGGAILSELHASTNGPLASKHLYMPKREQADDGSVSATIFVIEPDTELE